MHVDGWFGIIDHDAAFHAIVVEIARVKAVLRVCGNTVDANDRVEDEKFTVEVAQADLGRRLVGLHVLSRRPRTARRPNTDRSKRQLCVLRSASVSFDSSRRDDHFGVRNSSPLQGVARLQRTH